MKRISFSCMWIAAAIMAAFTAGIIQAQVKPAEGLTQKPKSKQLIVETLDGGKFKGSLLYADDSLLVLWQGSQSFDGTGLSLSAKAFHVSVLKGVTIGKGGHMLMGMVSGLLLGAIVGGEIGLAKGNDPRPTLNSLYIISLTARQKALMMGIPSALLGMIVGGNVGALIHDPHYPIDGDSEFYSAFLRAMGATGAGQGHIGSIGIDPEAVEQVVLWARVNRAVKSTP
jgi:hypothetical protein